MSLRARLWLVLVAFLAAVAALWAVIWVLDLEPQLGLDLEGGVSITLAPEEGQDFEEQHLTDAVEVLRSRVDAMGVAEPELARQGDNIIVQLPGMADQEQAEDVIQRTAMLQFRRVLEVYPPEHEDYDEVGVPCDEILEQWEGPPPDDEEIVVCEAAEGADEDELAEDLDPSERAKYRLGPTEVSGANLEDASAGLPEQGVQWQTLLEFDSEGAEAFAEVTADLACADVGSIDRQFAIVLDGQVQSAPQVAQDVPCGVGITGGDAVITVSGQEEAQELAVVLRGGSLPVQLEIVQSQLVSPSLGAASLQGGLQAGFLGLALVAIYLIALYRGMGVAAVAELAMFGVIVYGVLIVLGEAIGFTLTLAGIAGVVVAVGIAADSSIIYRERYRDEIRAGRTVRSAADEAFRRAFRTNLTGNTVSFLAAVVLYAIAVGPVRGFAFTLGLATVIDTLLFGTFTRSLFGLIANNRTLARSRWMGLRAESLNPTLVPSGARRRREGGADPAGEEPSPSEDDEGAQAIAERSGSGSRPDADGTSPADTPGRR